MRKRNMLATILAMVLGVFLLAACSGGNTPAPADGSGSEGGEARAADTLVVGYSPFNSKFSPFFAETAYDQDVQSMTQLSLLTTDRLGQVIYKGIEGETTEYNGTEYTYYGPADFTVTENEDGTVYYDIIIRDDIKFSDGEPMTIDDVIFNMYVVCDPTYDGNSTLFSQPIEGLEAYRSGMDTLANLLITAGKDNTDFSKWTEDQQKAFWDGSEKASVALAQEIVDYCGANGYNDEGDVVASAANWGFELAEGATVEDFGALLLESYENNIAEAVGVENAGSSIDDLFPEYSKYLVGVETGESAPNISGIQKTGDYSMRVVATEVSAPMIYQLGIQVAPLHYYGDKSLYDYDNNKFGFPKGDLSSVREKTPTPMGAGAYKFIKFENGVVNFEANETYYKGAPKIPYINFREVNDTDKLNGVVTGTIDVTDPSYSKDKANAIAEANGGEVTGSVITTDTVDNLGYGYIGINSHNVKVGDDPASEESRNLRKAFATIFAVYRDVAIDSYYGDAAEVINYPISNTSWAAPQPTDEDYRLAFSVDASGADIYTSDMSAEDKYEAAKAAALTFFEAAGYTVENGKVTAAPEGASMEYEVMIPADGSGDHPSFMILTESKNALADLGINLIVNDLSVSSEMWTALEAGQGEMWCAAWGATIDPDMYQVYYSDVANGGANAGGSQYMYQIEDPELDELIIEARTNTDQAYRKTVLKAALDIVIDWACEIPIYQRQNAIIFSTERVNMDTVTPDITPFYGWMSEIENMEMA